jgi:hypothetical protein
MSTKNNLIIVIVGAKQCGAQIIYLFTYLFLGVIYASANKSQALFTKSFHEPRNKIVFCNLS